MDGAKHGVRQLDERFVPHGRPRRIHHSSPQGNDGGELAHLSGSHEAFGAIGAHVEWPAEVRNFHPPRYPRLPEQYAWPNCVVIVLETVVQGNTVREVLNYVQYNAQTLIDQFRKDVEIAVREQRIGYEESGRLLKFYEEGLQGYTYLEQ